MTRSIIVGRFVMTRRGLHPGLVASSGVVTSVISTVCGRHIVTSAFLIPVAIPLEYACSGSREINWEPQARFRAGLGVPFLL